MSNPNQPTQPNGLVVRRTFLEYVEGGEHSEGSEGGTRSRSDPAIPSFAAHRRNNTMSSEDSGINMTDSESDSEVGGEADGEASSRRQSRRSSHHSLADLPIPETSEFSHLEDVHFAEEAHTELEDFGCVSSSGSSTTRLLVKNTFLEVVDDDEGSGASQHRRHTTGPLLRDARRDSMNAAGRGPISSIEGQLLERMLAQSDMRSQLSPARARPKKGATKGGKSGGSAASTSFGVGEEAAVLSERDPINPRFPAWTSASQTEASQAEMLMGSPMEAGVSSLEGPSSLSSGELTSGGISASAEEGVAPKADGPRTTVMLRNLPVSFSRDMLLSVLDREGFSARYDFVYLPIDFGSRSGFGYAFINLVDPDAAADFRVHFQGFTNWGIESSKVADITWSSTHQGLEEHVSRYRNSPVMHETMPDECKPIVLDKGVRIDFPPPTKIVRAPRIRPSKHRGARSGKPAEDS